MNATTLLFITTCVLFGYGAKGISKPKPKPQLDTVDELLKPQYYGLWYQIAANQAVYDTIERNNVCVTAQYGPNDDGTISVRNYAKIVSPDGPTTTIEGYAYTTDSEEPGKLRVHFDESVSPCDGYYWILRLGPLNEENKYAWAIISDNRAYFLFILARDVKQFSTIHRQEVMDLVNALGFDAIDTYQEDDCIYE